MNTQDCSACSEYSNSGTAPACPHCGHFTLISESVGDYDMARDEEILERMSDRFERESEYLQTYDYTY